MNLRRIVSVCSGFKGLRLGTGGTLVNPRVSSKAELLFSGKEDSAILTN
jgi:hypothetical protein